MTPTKLCWPTAPTAALTTPFYKEGVESWHLEGAAVRDDPTIHQQIVTLIDRHGVRSVAMTEGPIGCPHQEEIDDPEAGNCPECPYWAGRDRWTR